MIDEPFRYRRVVHRNEMIVFPNNASNVRRRENADLTAYNGKRNQHVADAVLAKRQDARAGCVERHAACRRPGVRAPTTERVCVAPPIHIA